MYVYECAPARHSEEPAGRRTRSSRLKLLSPITSVFPDEKNHPVRYDKPYHDTVCGQVDTRPIFVVFFLSNFNTAFRPRCNNDSGFVNIRHASNVHTDGITCTYS